MLAAAVRVRGEGTPVRSRGDAIDRLLDEIDVGPLAGWAVIQLVDVPVCTDEVHVLAAAVRVSVEGALDKRGDAIDRDLF